MPSRSDLEGFREVWVAGVESEMKVTPVDWALLASQGAAWMSYWDSHVRGTGRKTR